MTRGAPAACSARLCTVVDPGVGAVTLGNSRGPWPGSFYALPLACALVVLALLVALALRAIVNRPRPDLDSRGLDTLLRRWSVGNVLTAATVTVLGTLGPVAVLMASALAGSACPSTTVQTLVTGWLRSSGRWLSAPRSACWPGWCSRRRSGSTTCHGRCPAGRLRSAPPVR